MKQPLKSSVQQYLESKQLSPDQLQQLFALQENHAKNNPSMSQVWFKGSVFATVLLLFTFIFTPAYFSTPSIEQRIADEVAGNHLKLKPLEVSSNRLDDIKPYFKQLSFVPISPSFLTLSKQSLLGGRYCSIQGVTAMQLRLVDNVTGQVQSLYETEFDKDIFRHFSKQADEKNPVIVNADRINVRIWVEKGVLFALTE